MTKQWIVAAAVAAMGVSAMAQDWEGPTYAEKLGWPAGSKVVIFHSDDLGMHHDSNRGTIQSIEEGLCTSASTMMTCSWVPDWMEWLKANPDFDNGLHLTLTSEWNRYRWTPLSSVNETPGLYDPDGYMHKGVIAVALNATAEEVRTEIRAQIAMARRMGMPITHLDTHMGTVYAKEDFTMAYLQVGIEEQIPVMVPGGHIKQFAIDNPMYANRQAEARALGQMAWEGGLPVLDDLHMDVTGMGPKEEKVAELIRRLRALEPGVTQFIVHCTHPSEVFPKISSSGPARWSDVEVLTDPELKKVVEEEGIILTTWKELMERRQAVK